MDKEREKDKFEVTQLFITKIYPSLEVEGKLRGVGGEPEGEDS